MNTVELRTNIVHRLTNISDMNILEEINTMLDFNVSMPIFRCTEEQRKKIILAQQTVANEKKISHEEMNKAVESWSNEN